MRVVVLGGYGAFGGLLCHLLVRDGHEVWIAGRNLSKARALAERLGARALEVDIVGDLSAVFAVRPQAVVDAAGPFQDYEDAYRVPRACIAEGCDYFDLADASAFVEGISALDAGARQAGCRVVSGASSVPGLTSAVVAALAEGMEDIALIESAILPGNRAPRGRSVIASIVAQVGAPLRIWRGGGWQSARGWTDRRHYRLLSGEKRCAYLVDVPDLRLFPGHFPARSVTFRAGLELPVMNRSLALLATLRRMVPLGTGSALLRGLHWLSERLLPFGSDRGGMIVRVVGSADGRTVERRWDLLAEAGDGPFIPGIAVRTLLWQIESVPTGAYPCISTFPLNEAEAAMADLKIRTEHSETPAPSLFETTLGQDWDRLPAEVQALHRVQDLEIFAGCGSVGRGRNPLARLIATLFRFPPACDDLPVTVTMTRTAHGETWERNFDGAYFRSHLSGAGSGRFRERFGPFRYEMDLPVSNGALGMPVRRGWFLGVPLPRALLPISETREFVQDGRFRFDVRLSAPLVGLIVHYRGWLEPAGTIPTQAR